MEDGFEERAERYNELQRQIGSKQEELSELQAGTFGTDSEGAEERAREFFSNAGRDAGSGGAERIDELRGQISELEDEFDSVREDLLERLVDVQLPFEEVIEPGEDVVRFPFSEELSSDVIEAVEDVLNEDLGSGEVRITPEALVVETDDVEDAIEMAESRIEGLRANAGTKVDVDEYLDNLRGRDEKVALTLHILHQEAPLTKREIEERMGVEKGTLRGQLYYVLDNDPYLKKSGEEFSLTETGREVIEAFVEEYGVPEGAEQAQEVAG
jgi:hypothetical protein